MVGRQTEVTLSRTCLEAGKNFVVEEVVTDAGDAAVAISTLFREAVHVHEAHSRVLAIGDGAYRACHEVILEAGARDVDAARRVLEEEMVAAFAETFPDAPVTNLVDVKAGATWADLK